MAVPQENILPGKCATIALPPDICKNLKAGAPPYSKGAGNRYVDLATAANFFVQTEEQELEFMRVYFNGAVDEYERARFYIMRQIPRIIYSLKLVEVATKSKPKGQCIDQNMEGCTMKAFGELMAAGKISLAIHEGQLMLAKAQMNEAIRNMRSPRFADSLSKL